MRAGANASGRKQTARLIREYWAIYLMLAPIAACLLIYRYYPILLQFVLSFKSYMIRDGIWGSPWAGFENYEKLFRSVNFGRILGNTLRLSVLQILFGAVPPIGLSVLLFDMASARFRKFAQGILYIPHFFSWVVVYNIISSLFSHSGFINSVIAGLDGTAQDFLMQKSAFTPMLVGANMWKGLGWGTVIYMAALTGVDTDLYDAAKMDGAGPWQRAWHITLPGIRPVAAFVLTMNLGAILSAANTEEILLFSGPHNYSVSDVIGTWVLRQGLGRMQYGLGAAVSLFESTIGLILVLVSNWIVTRCSGAGLW